MGERTVTAEQRRQMIAEAAYLRAEQRGFDGGDPLRDWLEAEAEVDARLGPEPERDAVLAQFEERLATTRKKLQALRRKAASIEADARAEWQQDLERLASLRDTLETRLHDLHGEGRHVVQKVREQGVAALRGYLLSERAKLVDE